MNKPILLLLFLFSCAGAYAQNEKEQAKVDSEYYYMLTDKMLATSRESARFIRLYTKADSGMLKVEEFYLNDKPKLVAKTYRKELDFQSGIQGSCIEYYESGNRKSTKNYNKGTLVGEAVTYYRNGNLFSTVAYKTDGIYLKSCQDSTGKKLAENGNGTWLKFNADMDPAMFLEGPVVDGKENGIWKKHTGKATVNVVYKDGVLVSGDASLNVNQEFGPVEVPPNFPGGMDKFNAFVKKTLKYPRDARENNIQGRVTLTFVVESDGSMSGLTIVKGVSTSIDKEAIRIMMASPAWEPGKQYGKPVRIQYSLPIDFTL